MYTSESNNIQFHRFFSENRMELIRRTANLIRHNYLKTIIQCVKLGKEPPQIFGKLKLEDVTFYAYPFGFNIRGEVKNLSYFLIMKNLREQTKIMVTDSQPHVIIYSAHAVRRYKERLNLPEEFDFVDTCKHMVLNGCSCPRITGNMREVYGSNLNRRQITFISLNGAFLGYYSRTTDILYADTFLSSNEFRDDQINLDASRSEDLKLWKELHEQYASGEIDRNQLQKELKPFEFVQIGDKDSVTKLTTEEYRIKCLEKKDTSGDNTDFLNQANENRKKFQDKMKRKGFK